MQMFCIGDTVATSVLPPVKGGARGVLMKLTHYSFLLLFALSLCIPLGCSKMSETDSKSTKTGEAIVLTSKDGSKKLVYKIGAFSPQVKTEEDFDLVRVYMHEILEEVKGKDDIVTASLLLDAFQRKNSARLEFLIYNYLKEKMENEADSTSTY